MILLCKVDEPQRFGIAELDLDNPGKIKKIIEKPGVEEILSPYAASVMFIFPAAIWGYLAKVEPSPRGEIEMQTAVQKMIEEGYQAYGVLQSAPEEWDPAHHLTPGT